MSQWDSDVPFEIETRTNWAEELLGIATTIRATEQASDPSNGKKQDLDGRDDSFESINEEEKEDSWPMTHEKILPGKDVFLLSPCFTAEECMRIIAGAEAVGFGRTNYPKSYRLAIE